MDNTHMNMNNTERVIRGLIGFGIFFWGLYADNFWGLLGFLLVFSGIFGYSPLYALLKIDTRRPREKFFPQAGEPKHPVPTSSGT